MTPPSRLALALLGALVGIGLAAPAALAVPGWRWPVDGQVVTHYRNSADPYARGQHRGIDIAAPAGTRVVAAAGGTVRFAGAAGDSGLTVAVRTSDGRFDTSYLHLGSIEVRAGDAVPGGAVLGTVGTTGRPSFARPHLHFGVRDAGSRHEYRDPLDLLPPPPSPEPRAPRPVPVAVPEPLAPRAAPARPVPVLLPVPLTPRAAPLAAPVPQSPRAVPLAAPPSARGADPLARPAPLTPRAAPLGTPRPAGAAEPAVVPEAAPPLTQGSPLRANRDRPRAAAIPRLNAHRGSRPAEYRPARVDLGVPPSAAPAPGSEQRSRTVTIAPRAGRSRQEGLDLGWLAACAGLVAAAALLGRPRGPAGSLRAARRLVTHAERGEPASSIAPWPATRPRRSTT
jgi:hypothetical protein